MVVRERERRERERIEEIKDTLTIISNLNKPIYRKTKRDITTP